MSSPSAASMYMRLLSHGDVRACKQTRLNTSVKVFVWGYRWVLKVQWSVKSHTSGFQRIRIFFISSTLLCAPPKQRPCRDTETLNYSSSHSIKHEYQQHVPATVIHASLRKWVLKMFPRMLWDDAKGLTASTCISTAFLTYYHGDETWGSVIKDGVKEADEHRFVQLE